MPGVAVAKALETCRRFRKADIATWVAHVNGRKCRKCVELAKYFERESLKRVFFRNHRN
jgi:hypothetical protein